LAQVIAADTVLEFNQLELENAMPIPASIERTHQKNSHRTHWDKVRAELGKTKDGALYERPSAKARRELLERVLKDHATSLQAKPGAK
jgi:hypothetical protein